jgi:hypothetical protein
MTALRTPLITCIVCAFNEGDGVQVSLESISRQSFPDFEVIVVDDGADTETRAALHAFRDPRFHVIRQANDGLSSARNRGLRHARGKYICFLDGDDSRPIWGFRHVAMLLEAHEPDALFTAGGLSEIRGEYDKFYDTNIINTILGGQPPRAWKVNDPAFRDILPYLLLLEPQAANKFVRADLLRRAGLLFPNGYFFEDILFHSALLASCGSVVVSDVPCFTYHRRYGRPQITAGSGESRLDAIAVAKMTMESFAVGGRFSNVLARAALLVAACRLLQWCELAISHIFRWQFHEALVYFIETLDPAYLDALSAYQRSGLPYQEVLPFIRALQAEASSRRATS